MQRFAALLLFALFACTGAGATERCKDVCKRDAECFEQLDEEERAGKFERDECEAICATLERDDKGKEMVEAHVACVLKAGDSCDAVRSCP